MRKSRPTLGDRLRHAREAKGLSQYDVATQAGIRPESLNRIERGKANAALVSLHKLAPVLGLKMDELVGLHATLTGVPTITTPSKTGKTGKTSKVTPSAAKKGKKT